MTKKYLELKKKTKIAFNKKDYDGVLRSFCNANLQEENLNKKERLYVKMICILADMANTFEDEAKTLWEYYQVINKRNSCEPESVILEMLENFDSNLYALNSAMLHMQDVEIESSNGVLYDDFKQLSQQVGFKNAFVDLMLSSKIIFTNKSDFLIFIQKLAENGFKDIAINYFENAGSSMFFDKDFVQAFQKLMKK
ncbi:MAG: hypothetical protein SOW25_08205 [Helicobacter sp.]|nr:hypothetical protein [Helicobacteraceae bacterium]MDY3114286.1 hypothetical protein [Helicobacter sp.]